MEIEKWMVKDYHRDQLISTKLELFEPYFITINNRTCPYACRAHSKQQHTALARKFNCKTLNLDFGLIFKAVSAKLSVKVIEYHVLLTI